MPSDHAGVSSATIAPAGVPSPRGLSSAADAPLPTRRSLREALRKYGAAATGFRRDIQGLRAVAVLLVVIYHVWPAVVPGGFVGVDVFFVISGYLIVGSLVRELRIRSTINLLSFYARRILRLLPAAAAVLLATLAATMLFLPEGRWQDVARDAVASSLNIQNWNQAFSTTSYAGATAAVSPLQHYWSLAVEEQFYLVVPVLLLGAAAAVRALGLRAGLSGTALAVICGVTVLSFVHSVLFSAASPDMAYFFTTTRVWELGLGGILALAAGGRTLRPALSTGCGWAGVLMIIASAFTFSTNMHFPGWIALVPTLGAALCILAGQRTDAVAPWMTAAWWQSLRPVAYIGDISYSLYLWHWPVTVFAVYGLGQGPGFWSGAGIIAAGIILGALSTRFIEKPLRRFRGRTGSVGRHGAVRVTYRPAFVLAAVLVAAPIVVAAVPFSVVQQKIDGLSAAYDFGSYPGAMAFDSRSPAAVPAGQPFRPEAAAARADGPAADRACTVFDPEATDPGDCIYGDPEGEKDIVLVGDSHAAQFMTPLDLAAKENGYRLYVLTRNGCPFNARPLHSDTYTYTNCSEQNLDTVQDILDIKPDLVVTTAMRPASYEHALDWAWESPDDAVEGYLEVLEPLQEADLNISVIADIPYPEFSAPECLLEKGTPDGCDVPRPDDAGQTDPLVEAAARLDGSRKVDLTDYFCDGDRCPAVIGNVLTYRDNHMTNTFARTLVLPLSRQLGL